MSKNKLYNINKIPLKRIMQDMRHIKNIYNNKENCKEMKRNMIFPLILIL